MIVRLGGPKLKQARRNGNVEVNGMIRWAKCVPATNNATLHLFLGARVVPAVGYVFWKLQLLGRGGEISLRL